MRVTLAGLLKPLTRHIPGSMRTIVMGYASILRLYPVLGNPSSSVSRYCGLAAEDEDLLAVNLDRAQIAQDVKRAFNQVVAAVEREESCAG